MNNAYIKESIRSLLIDNENTLVAGFVHQGQQRQIRQVALTNLTPPSEGYYYILIYIPDSREAGLVSATPTNVRPKRMAEYDVQVEISDEALVQIGDPEAYEIMALDFDKFTDRIADLLEGVAWLDDDHTLKIRRGTGATDRRIEKTNLSGNYFNTESEEVALLYAQLRFTVSEECVDTSRLYS